MDTVFILEVSMRRPEAERVGPWAWAESASTHPGGLFSVLRHFKILTVLSEAVKGSSEISPRRDRRAVVGRDSRFHARGSCLEAWVTGSGVRPLPYILAIYTL